MHSILWIFLKWSFDSVSLNCQTNRFNLKNKCLRKKLKYSNLALTNFRTPSTLQIYYDNTYKIPIKWGSYTSLNALKKVVKNPGNFSVRKTSRLGNFFFIREWKVGGKKFKLRLFLKNGDYKGTKLKKRIWAHYLLYYSLFNFCTKKTYFLLKTHI